MARARKTAEKSSETAASIVAYKGFNDDLTCTPDGVSFQYAIGETYRHDGPVKVCKTGFHACEHPLDVLKYYRPATSRFAVVELSGATDRETNGDTKIAAAEITIRAEIRLPALIQAAVKYVMDRVKWIDGPYAKGAREAVRSAEIGGAATASGDGGAATASGPWGAATASGPRGAATASGDGGAATASGWRGAATASGDGGAATASGPWGAATASGPRGAATASGDGGAATASGWRGAATASGPWGAATASGYRGAATAWGWQGAATASGPQGAATATGHGGKVRGKTGCALFLVERAIEGAIVHAWAGIVGRDGIEPDTWYRLEDGKPVVVAETTDD